MQEINARGIVLWHSGLRLHLQCLPPVWAPVQVPVDPLLIQSPVNVLRKQWNMVLVTRLVCSKRETKKLLPPAFSHLGGKPTGGIPPSLPILYLSV